MRRWCESALNAEGAATDLIRDHFNEKADFLRRLSSDLSSRVRLTDRLEKLNRKRGAYQDQQAEGLITIDELKAKLALIEEERSVIQGDLDSLKVAKDQLADFELLRDTLLDRVHNGFFEHATTTPQDRHDLYKKMGLRVEVDGSGNAMLSGALLPGEAFVSENSRRPPAPRRKLPPPR